MKNNVEICFDFVSNAYFMPIPSSACISKVEHFIKVVYYRQSGRDVQGVSKVKLKTKEQRERIEILDNNAAKPIIAKAQISDPETANQELSSCL